MKSNNIKTGIILLFVFSLLILTSYSCVQKSDKTLPKLSEVKHPEWSRNAVIYEVNVRQYSKEGTFKAFEKDLPRLKELGVDLIWVMPINPIGEVNRKGELGSYYSVKDYKAINPEFGTIDDFKQLVKATHDLGMKIIIDWVPNHTSWDNVLTKEHPDYYMKDSSGNYVSPFDWTDVIRLDYTNPDTRNYMTETMQWWLTETDIDGFRCDVAHMVPVDFWNELRPQLEKIKPVFMLAESDQPFLNEKAFDMTYDWKFHHIMNQVAQGKMSANAIIDHFNWVDTAYPKDSYILQFTSNHDENSWNGTEFERMNGGAKTFAVISTIMPDMLLIYNGQESAFNRRLKFFEKDSIDWNNYAYADFYKTLANLEDRNTAMRNGSEGGKLQFIMVPDDSTVLACTRITETDKIVMLCNLKNVADTVTIESKLLEGSYKEVFTNEQFNFGKSEEFILQPWQYMVLEAE
jgi:1,4-alpha-glucan branching enzyme